MFDYLIKKTKTLESEIDFFLENITKSGLVFFETIKDYLNEENIDSRIKQISEIESKTDEVRRKIKFKLYKHMLIPESRGDVLGLLETMDDLADIVEEVAMQFNIESPDIKQKFKNKFIKLSEYSSKSVEETSKAGHAFFRDLSKVNDYINKIRFYESEADTVQNELKIDIFNDDEIDLAKKMHLRYFVDRIASLSDEAEEVSERLSIYSIKRMI